MCHVIFPFLSSLHAHYSIIQQIYLHSISLTLLFLMHAQPDKVVYSASLQAAGEEFLLPFTAQPFSAAVSSAKILVAANEYLSKKHTQELELKTFGERWGSAEKKTAFEKK